MRIANKERKKKSVQDIKMTLKGAGQTIGDLHAFVG